MSEVIQCFRQFDFMVLILACAVIAAGWLAWKINGSDNRFKFADLFLDPTGKASMSRVGQWVALCLSSWLLVYVTLHEKYSESAFGLYMASWSLTAVANKYAEKRNEQ